MNLPVGPIIEQGIGFGPGAFKQKVLSMAQEQFSGYIALTIEGYDGLEDGVLIFKSGILVASIYEYLKHGILVMGDLAIPQVFNASGAKSHIADIIALTNSQVDLILAFNEKSGLSKAYSAKDINELSVSEYSSAYAERILAEALKKEPSKYEVLKRLGLSEMK